MCCLPRRGPLTTSCSSSACIIVCASRWPSVSIPAAVERRAELPAGARIAVRELAREHLVAARQHVLVEAEVAIARAVARMHARRR